MSNPKTHKGVNEKEVISLNDGFAKRLEEIKEQLSPPTQDAFAQLIGVKQSVVQRWFKGRLPAAEYLYKISKVTGKSIDWLLTGEEPSPRPEWIKLLKEITPKFNIVAGLASIVSLILSIFAVKKVYQLKNILNLDSAVKGNKQVIHGSRNRQAGRDINEK